MPNSNNIDSPVTLVGFGRSGTSLVSNLFDRHPDFTLVGETQNLVFNAWWAVESSAHLVAPMVEEGGWVSPDERGARVVRRTMLECFPDELPRWFQKPIGVPAMLRENFELDQREQAAQWYWRVLRTSFPRSRFVTILRHPCDVVLSAHGYWGFSEAGLWESLALLADIIASPTSAVDYAISYDELVADPEGTVRALFAHLDVEFRPEVLEAFSTVHAPARDRRNLTEVGTSRRNEWSSLDPQHLFGPDLESLKRSFKRFGRSFEIPAHLESGVASKRREKKRPPGKVLARMHEEYLAKLQEQEAHARTVFTEQQAWIAELETAKQWLTNEVSRWRALALSHEALLTERERESQARPKLDAREHQADTTFQPQQARIAGLETAKTWLVRQANHWQRETRASHASTLLTKMAMALGRAVGRFLAHH